MAETWQLRTPAQRQCCMLSEMQGGHPPDAPCSECQTMCFQSPAIPEPCAFQWLCSRPSPQGPFSAAVPRHASQSSVCYSMELVYAHANDRARCCVEALPHT